TPPRYVSPASPPSLPSSRPLHDALPISSLSAAAMPERSTLRCSPDLRYRCRRNPACGRACGSSRPATAFPTCRHAVSAFCATRRSEEHTSELQSRENLVCPLLRAKKHHL